MITLQQSGSAYNPGNDYARNEYTANFAAANYALAQAQLTQNHANNLSRLKEQSCSKESNEVTSNAANLGHAAPLAESGSAQWLKPEWGNNIIAAEGFSGVEGGFGNHPQWGNVKNYWS